MDFLQRPGELRRPQSRSSASRRRLTGWVKVSGLLTAATVAGVLALAGQPTSMAAGGGLSLWWASTAAAAAAVQNKQLPIMLPHTDMRLSCDTGDASCNQIGAPERTDSTTPAPDGRGGLPGPENSTGQTGGPLPPSSDSGRATGAPPVTGATPPPVQVNPPATASWQVYRNDQLGFEVGYPPSIMPFVATDPLVPPLLFHLSFQEVQLGSMLAGLAPPQFAVDVYDNPGQASLNTWLLAFSAGGTPPLTTQEAIQIGGTPGVRLTLMTQLAPNVVYYVARGRYVYQFTPLGASTDQMLATVHFLPQAS
jgi:hypothetical protein